MLRYIGVCLLIVGCVSSAEASEDQSWVKDVEMPLGNIERGREVFVQYRCFQCHKVVGDSELPQPKGEVRGPGFDKRKIIPLSMLERKQHEMRLEMGLPVLDYRAEKFAMSIMSPSHTIALGYGKGSAEDEPKSDMPDFSDQMTLKELRDVVAYLIQAGA